MGKAINNLIVEYYNDSGIARWKLEFLAVLHGCQLENKFIVDAEQLLLAYDEANPVWKEIKVYFFYDNKDKQWVDEDPTWKDILAYIKAQETDTIPPWAMIHALPYQIEMISTKLACIAVSTKLDSGMINRLKSEAMQSYVYAVMLGDKEALNALARLLDWFALVTPGEAQNYETLGSSILEILKPQVGVISIEHELQKKNITTIIERINEAIKQCFPDATLLRVSEFNNNQVWEIMQALEADIQAIQNNDRNNSNISANMLDAMGAIAEEGDNGSM